MLAWAVRDGSAALATPLFCGGWTAAQDEPANDGTVCWQAAGPLPAGWGLGTELALRGPFGKGFQLPVGVRRVVAVALTRTPDRLLPLVRQALTQGAAVALFTDMPSGTLPEAVEIYPTGALHDYADWPDYLALDIPAEMLGSLRKVLGLRVDEALSCMAEALVEIAMPCGGLGECGVCAIPGRRSYRLACVNGPVIDLRRLSW